MLWKLSERGRRAIERCGNANIQGERGGGGVRGPYGPPPPPPALQMGMFAKAGDGLLKADGQPCVASG